MEEEYISFAEIEAETKLTEKQLLRGALNQKYWLYHYSALGWQKVPLGPLKDLYNGEKVVKTAFYTEKDGKWLSTIAKECAPNGQVINEIKSIQWEVTLLHIRETDLNRLKQREKVQEHTLTQLLQEISPQMYDTRLSPNEKGAITKSLSTLKRQLPKALKLCCQIVMESAPFGDREECITHSSQDIIDRASEKGINTPMAREIYSNLPQAMKR